MAYPIIGEPITCTIDTYPQGTPTPSALDAILDFNNGEVKNLQLPNQRSTMIESSQFNYMGSFVISLSIKSKNFFLPFSKHIFGKFEAFFNSYLIQSF
jgi:hypothetical protein